MNDTEKLRKLDDFVMELALKQERAQLIAERLSSGYFALSKESAIYDHDSARIECDIVLDYLLDMKEQLVIMREILEENENPSPVGEDVMSKY